MAFAAFSWRKQLYSDPMGGGRRIHKLHNTTNDNTNETLCNICYPFKLLSRLLIGQKPDPRLLIGWRPWVMMKRHYTNQCSGVVCFTSYTTEMKNEWLNG